MISNLSLTVSRMRGGPRKTRIAFWGAKINFKRLEKSPTVLTLHKTEARRGKTVANRTAIPSLTAGLKVASSPAPTVLIGPSRTAYVQGVCRYRLGS